MIFFPCVAAETAWEYQWVWVVEACDNGWVVGGDLLWWVHWGGISQSAVSW
jgi:hypothetical protein